MSSSWPLCQLCGCGWALSSSCPPLGHTPELCQLCGWTLWLGLWLGLVLLLSSSWPRPSTLSTLWLGSVAGLCGWALSSSCPPLGRAKELCQLGFAAVLCGLVVLLSSSWPRPEHCQLCGWALCPGLVLLNSVNSEKEKKERKKERKKESRARARARVCFGRRALARPDIRSRKARSGRALQRERQRKRNLKRK